MHPAMMIVLGIITPVPLALAFLLPLYASLFCTVLVIYHQQIDTLLPAFTNVVYILGVFEHAVDYWLKHLATVNHFTYSLPLIIIPLLGLALATFVTIKLSQKIKNVFQT